MSKSRVQASTEANRNGVPTTSEVFSDGTAIELVSSTSQRMTPKLLLWKKTGATTAAQVKYRGRIYESPELSSDFYRAIRLPAGCSDYRSVRALFKEMVSTFDQHLQLSNGDSKLLTSFAISTWLADRLPVAPNVVMSGDQRLGVEVLKLLSCLCRRPLLLTELTPGGFRSLPLQMSLTLLIHQQSLRPSMLRLFHASTYRGLYLAGNSGSLINIYGPRAVYCRSDCAKELLGECTIHIPLAQSWPQWASLDDTVQSRIANEFQPRLLSFRLANLWNMHEPRVAGERFTAATRELAFALGACLSEDPELALETVQLLSKQDEDARMEKQCDVSCVVIEILWGLVHHGQQKNITVDELTKMVNTLLQSRGGYLNYSAEEIGWKLRGMGVPRHTSITGRQVVLDRETRQTIHDLARACELSCVGPNTGCSDCGVTQAIVSKPLMKV